MLIFIEIQFDQNALYYWKKLFSKQLFVPKVDVGHLSALISFLNLWEKFPQYPATNHSAIGTWKLSLNPKQRFNHVQIQLNSNQHKPFGRNPSLALGSRISSLRWTPAPESINLGFCSKIDYDRWIVKSVLQRRLYQIKSQNMIIKTFSLHDLHDDAVWTVHDGHKLRIHSVFKRELVTSLLRVKSTSPGKEFIHNHFQKTNQFHPKWIPLMPLSIGCSIIASFHH